MNESEIRKIVQNTIAAIKPDKSKMTLTLAERLCDAVIEEARRMGVKAVVCVSDGAGNPKLLLPCVGSEHPYCQCNDQHDIDRGDDHAGQGTHLHKSIVRRSCQGKKAEDTGNPHSGDKKNLCKEKHKAY